MTIHLPKVNQFGGGNGGGGSSSFPVTVTSSGSSLPVDLTGYSLGDTFLNTTNKKIYTATADKYVINSYFNNNYSISNNLLDITTGIMDFVGGSKSFSINSFNWSGYTLKVPFVATDITNSQTVVQIKESGGTTNYCDVTISNSKIICNSEDICNIEVSKIYIIEIVVTGSQYVSSRSGTLKIYTETGEKIGEKTFSYSANTVRIGFGYFSQAGPSINYFTGKIYPYVNDYSFYLGSYDIVVPDTNLSWDNGVSIEDKTEYADKTNGILYLYEDTELIQIPQNKNLVFTNVSASSWVSDSTYTDYGYKCELSCSGVTANDFAQVIFAPTEADSGNYATVCQTGSGTVTIYSKVNDTITIPSIVVMGV